MSGAWGDAKLCIALDVRHPFSHLALGPALALGRERGLAIDWWPIEVPPLRPPSEPAPGDDRGVWHRRHRARMIAREIAVYSAAAGQDLAAPDRDGPAAAAHQAWLFVKEHRPALLEGFLERVFAACRELLFDANDHRQVAGIVSECGADGEACLAWSKVHGEAALEASAAALAEAGVFQAPAYQVAAELFHGRQHLPMIRWLLDDREGPVPI